MVETEEHITEGQESGGLERKKTFLPLVKIMPYKYRH
jgi:hypothetical protein